MKKPKELQNKEGKKQKVEKAEKSIAENSTDSLKSSAQKLYRIDYSNLSVAEIKARRQQIRGKMKSIVYRLSKLSPKKESYPSLVKEFKDLYEREYVLNDYSVKSVYTGTDDALIAAIKASMMKAQAQN
jgi:hypothetical protein